MHVSCNMSCHWIAVVVLTLQAAGDYEEIRDTQQQTEPNTLSTIYSTVYTGPGGNQIQDPPLYSILSDQPESCTNQTPNSRTNAATLVTYASIKKHTEGCGPNTLIRSGDTETYDTCVFLKTHSDSIHTISGVTGSKCFVTWCKPQSVSPDQLHSDHMRQTGPLTWLNYCWIVYICYVEVINISCLIWIGFEMQVIYRV